MIPHMPPHPSRITCVLVLCHAVLATGGAASAEELSTLLDKVAANAAFGSPARADVRIECTSGCPKAGGQAILLGRGDALYVETKGGQRALVRPGRVVVAGGVAKAGERLADTDVAPRGSGPVHARRAQRRPRSATTGRPAWSSRPRRRRARRTRSS
jgi:hypothetical protein